MSAYTQGYVFTGNAKPTTLAVAATSASTTLSLADATGWPSPTGVQLAIATLNPDTSQEVKITFGGRSGNDLTGVTWDYDGTTASGTYQIGTNIRHSISAELANDLDAVKRATLGKMLTPASASTAAAVVLHEDTDNGTNKVTVIAPASVTADRTVTLPDETGTVITTGTSATTGMGFVVDEDDMTSNSATKVPTQQSVKAYVDANSGTYGARVRKSSAQALNNDTATTLSWDTEVFDTNTLHDNATNNSRLTLNKVGTWLVGGIVQFAANATGYRCAFIYKNGAGYSTPIRVPAASGIGTNVPFAEVVQASAITDYVELLAQQNSGGSLNVESGGDASFFWAIYLGA